jgi:two-component system sensor histidine kinase EvgS
VLDINMPEMDGLEATRIIRQLEEKSDKCIPIIAITASVMKEEREKYAKVGMNATVGKPIDFNELFSTIEKIMPNNTGVPLNKKTSVIHTSANKPSLDLIGIDMTVALGRWKKVDVFKQGLTIFVKSNSDTAEKLFKLSKAQQWQELLQVNHKLKGVAGNLAMTEVYSLTLAIEKSLHEGQQGEELINLVFDLNNALKIVLNSIQEYL